MAAFTVAISRVPHQKAQTSAGSQLLASGIHLSDVREYSYLINVGFGGWIFPVIFDTGSSDLWVVSSSCSSLEFQGVMGYSNTASLSMSSVPFSLSYLAGAVTGTIGYETVSFGQFEISSQVFALVNHTNGLDLSTVGNSGILGLAFPAITSISSTAGHTLLENIYAHLEPASRFFAFNLGRDDTGGNFSVGEINTTFAPRVSEFLYSPVYSKDGASFDYWKLPLLGITINSTAVPFALSRSKVKGSQSPIAVLDTGTTLILGPTKDVDDFWSAAGGAMKGSDQQWRVKCSHAITVGLVLGNDTSHREFILDPLDISWGNEAHNSEEWCIGGIQANDDVFSGDWLLGDVFLRNVYTTHHAGSDAGPPVIGLLGLTDPTSAMSRFTDVRGYDSVPLVAIRTGNLGNMSFTSSTLPVLALVALLSFLGTFVSTFLFRARTQSKKLVQTMGY